MTSLSLDSDPCLQSCTGTRDALKDALPTEPQRRGNTTVAYLVHPPYSRSKNHLVVKFLEGPRSFGIAQTSGVATTSITSESQPEKSSPSASVSPSGQQPNLEAV